MKDILTIGAAVLIIVALGAFLINWRVSGCHDRGGEVNYFSQSYGLCLTPDGRVIP